MPDLNWKRDTHNLQKAAGLVCCRDEFIFDGLRGMPRTSAWRHGATGIQSIKHIVFMVQENRSLDNYFGQLPAYFAANASAGDSATAVVQRSTIAS